MGLVVLQLGQAGNQLGVSFFNSLATNGLSAQNDGEFFRDTKDHTRLVARAVLIDMEPKVVAASLKKAISSSGPAHGSRAWCYAPGNVVSEESGAGNNWARGFYRHGPRSREEILDAVRREVEEVEQFGGFVTLQSMAGGTGSGLGSYLVEALKDEYPSACILSNCIWPYESGEVILQNYNLLLTLSHLQASADGIILLQNEALSATCKRALGIARPSFDDMNDVATESLACILSPASWRPEASTHGSPAASSLRMTRKLKAASDAGITQPPAPTATKMHVLPDIVALLCSHPSFRLLTLRFGPQVAAKSVAFTSFSWESELKQMRHSLNSTPLREVEMEPHIACPEAQAAAWPPSVDRCIANMLVLRGPGSQYADASAFADSRLYPIWSVDPLGVAAHPAKFRKHEIATGLLSNCQSSVVPAIRVLSSAYGMYASKAYLHQYFEHGMEEATFEAAFATVEDLVTRYLTI